MQNKAPGRHPTCSNKTFTLIELLVVIAIIAILAAMLLPSLSRARYKAKLTLDANDQRQTAIGLIMYLDDYGEWDRAVLKSPAGDNPFQALIKADDMHDDRPRFADYLSEDLGCPFRVDQSGSWTSTSRAVYSPFVIYAGWQLANGERKFSKPDTNLTYRDEEFDIIIAEKDGILPAHNKVSAAHPDNVNLWEKVLPGQAGSYWYTNTTYVRGQVDLNYTRSDGSTFLIRRVLHQDSRLFRVPHKRNESIGSRYQQLPSVSYQ